MTAIRGMKLKVALSIFGGSILVGCGIGLLWMLGFFDEVHRTYEDKEQATAARLFEKGWLPDFIPESSKNISMVNNLDINTTRGSFDFEPSDLDRFITRIQNSNDDRVRLGSERKQEKELSDDGYMIFNCSVGDSAWKFFIHPRGHCEFWGSSYTGP